MKKYNKIDISNVSKLKTIDIQEKKIFQGILVHKKNPQQMC